MCGLQALSVESVDAFDRQLEAIEFALAAGDVDAARRCVGNARSALVDRSRNEPLTLAYGVALTGQEIASLRMLPDGSLSQKDIARVMGVTRNTLKTHLKSLYLKLGVHCRSEAIQRGREIGLLPRPLAIVSPAGLLADETAA